MNWLDMKALQKLSKSFPRRAGKRPIKGKYQRHRKRLHPAHINKHTWVIWSNVTSEKCIGLKGQASWLHLVSAEYSLTPKEIHIQILMCSRMYSVQVGVPSWYPFQKFTWRLWCKNVLSPDRASSEGQPPPGMELDPHYFFSIPPSVDSTSHPTWLGSAQLGCLGSRKTLPPLNHFTCSFWRVYICNRNPAQHSIDYYL